MRFIAACRSSQGWAPQSQQTQANPNSHRQTQPVQANLRRQAHGHAAATGERPALTQQAQLYCGGGETSCQHQQGQQQQGRQPLTDKQLMGKCRPPFPQDAAEVSRIAMSSPQRTPQPLNSPGSIGMSTLKWRTSLKTTNEVTRATGMPAAPASRRANRAERIMAALSSLPPGAAAMPGWLAPALADTRMDPGA